MALTKATRVLASLIIWKNRFLSSRLSESPSINDYKVITTEQDRWVTAINELNSRGGGTLLVPAGSYTFTGTAATSITTRVRIKFQSGASLTQTAADADVFNITGTGSGSFHVQGAGQIMYRGGNSSTTAAAIRFKGQSRVRSLIVEGGLQITKDVNSGSQFKYGVHATNCQDPIIRDLLCDGIQGTYHFVGLFITALDNPSVSWTLEGIDVYDGLYGIHVVNTRAPGVEGLKLINCDLVAVMHGLYYDNQSSYYPPQIELIGCHINSRDSNVRLKKVLQVKVIGGLYYRTYSAPSTPTTGCFFDLNDVQDFLLDGATMSVTNASVNVPAIIATNCAFLRIDNCHQWMNARASAFLKVVGTITICKIAGGNTKDTIGPWVDTTDMTGSIANIGISDQLSLTAADQSTFVDPGVDGSSGTLNLSIVRKGLCNITNVTDSSLITAITGVGFARMYTVRCNTVGVTIQRNAGILLRGEGNFVFRQSGDMITFILTTTGQLREVSRSNPENILGLVSASFTAVTVAAGATVVIGNGVMPAGTLSTRYETALTTLAAGCIIYTTPSGGTGFRTYAFNPTTTPVSIDAGSYSVRGYL